MKRRDTDPGSRAAVRVVSPWPEESARIRPTARERLRGSAGLVGLLAGLGLLATLVITVALLAVLVVIVTAIN